MNILTNALELGATMYIPATHENLWDVTQGIKYPELKSVVVCLEDAVREDDYEKALENLNCLFKRIAMNDGKESGPAIFIRPRNIDSGYQILDLGYEDFYNGFVVPKFTLDTLDEWKACTENQSNVMLTLETGEYFDSGYLSEVKYALCEDFNENVLCLRIGGNDLLSSINLRRPRECTIYDTPIGSLIPKLVGNFVPKGFQLSSPVFEHYSNVELLKQELALDNANGLTTKTAIHPIQLKLIHEAYKVCSVDYYEAQMIVDAQAKSVFKSNGSMLEPATHRNWANEILLRAKIYGVIENYLQVLNHPTKQAI
jgi:citrate lyase beta subunit